MKSQNDDSTYDHVIKYTGLFGGVQGLTLLMGIVRNKIVSVFLGPSGSGLINMFSNLLKFINQGTNLGISFSAVRHVSELFDTGDMECIGDYVATVRTWSVLTALFGMLLCAVLSPWLSYWTFGNYDYALSILMLSPIVAALSVQGGELAVLKGMKALKKVALVSVLITFTTLVVCTPLYYFFRYNGIVASLLLSYVFVMIITLRYSTRLVPWSTELFTKSRYIEGLPMVKLGLGFIIAGIFGQGADWIIRSLIIHFSDVYQVGLYNCGYVMAVSYANMVFVAIEADYFPRLSAANHDLVRQNNTVNQQIEVCVMLIAPCLIFFVSVMPYIVWLLYDSEFLPAAPMAVCATFFMFFKALALPAAYLPLAKGDSRMYMITELIYDVFVAIAIPLAFSRWGLIGAGCALSLGGFMDFLMIHGLYRFKYGYKFDFGKLNIFLVQFILFSSAVYASFQTNPYIKWIIAIVAFAISFALTLRLLRRQTSFVAKIKRKVLRR